MSRISRRTGDNIIMVVAILALFVVSNLICYSAGRNSAKGAERQTRPVMRLSELNLPAPASPTDIEIAIRNVEEAKRREEETKREEEARRVQADSRQASPGTDPGTVTVERVYSVEECRGIGYRICVATFGESEWLALDELWGFRADGSVLESGWDPLAHNSSGAHGIPQAVPGSKMASEGEDWYWNPETQIRWGCNYIISHGYGMPTEALRFRLEHGWY